jgi:hypothetical protein
MRTVRKSIPPWCNCQNSRNQVGNRARVRLQGRRHEKGERSVGALRFFEVRQPSRDPGWDGARTEGALLSW